MPSLRPSASGLVRNASGLVRDASGLVRDASGLVRDASGLVRDDETVESYKAVTETTTNLSRHEDLRVIMTDGITFAGFNTIDIEKISGETSLGVIPVMKRMPDFKKIGRALDNFADKEERWQCIEKAGPIHCIPVHRGVLYFQYAGLQKEEAEKIIGLTCMHSQIPEPVRVAHIIATGIIRGEASRKP